MTKRMWLQAKHGVMGLVVAVGMLVPATAQAQITRVSSSDHRQAISFNVGYFALRPEDARPVDDVLRVDLDSLAFEIDDFNGVTFGGEWLFGLTEYLEGGVGVSYYQNSVHSVYRGFVNANNSEITQELKLRTTPVTASVRFLPIGRGAVEPYVGGGISFVNWRYSETGEFVDFSDDSIFRDSYSASGTAVGPVVLGGIRIPFADVWAIGAELRHQWAEGDTNRAESKLLADKIDLGGWTANFSVHLRF